MHQHNFTYDADYPVIRQDI